MHFQSPIFDQRKPFKGGQRHGQCLSKRPQARPKGSFWKKSLAPYFADRFICILTSPFKIFFLQAANFLPLFHLKEIPMKRFSQFRAFPEQGNCDSIALHITSMYARKYSECLPFRLSPEICVNFRQSFEAVSISRFIFLSRIDLQKKKRKAVKLKEKLERGSIQAIQSFTNGSVGCPSRLRPFHGTFQNWTTWVKLIFFSGTPEGYSFFA